MKTELVTTLKRQATRILSELHESQEPILITEHGRPSAYLIDIDSYQQMLDRMTILEGIARGERAVVEKRVFTRSAARKKIGKWLD